MLPLRHGLLVGATIPDFINATAGNLARQNWLFVAIDSSRGELLAKGGPGFSEDLLSLQLESWSGAEGLWVPGRYLPEVLQRTSLIVPYTAAYIFDHAVRGCDEPRYTWTSESDDFSDQVPDVLRSELERLNAEGYVADGDGLNYAIRGKWADGALAALTSPLRPVGDDWLTGKDIKDSEG